MIFKEWLEDLLVSHNIYNVLIMVSITIIVGILKLPIKHNANKLVDFAIGKGININKAVVTNTIFYLPYAVGSVLFVAKELIIMMIEKSMYDYSEVVSNILIYSALSIALYEMIDMQLKKAKSSKKYKLVKGDYKTFKRLEKSDLPMLECLVENNRVEEINDEKL